MPKIVMIGVGSMVFGAGTLVDLLHFKDQLAGSTVCLVDIDPQKAELMHQLASKLNSEAGSPLTIKASVDRRAVLAGADFVITSPAIKREALWQQDWEIVRAAGLRQTYGESGGPGALSHTLRNVPLLLSICRDIEALAPEALVINYTNPEARICMAIDRYTSLRFVGLCHQIGQGYRNVSRVLEIPADDLDFKAAGINHFTWVHDMRRRSSGEDLYARFERRLQAMPAEFEPLSRRLFATFGLYPTSGDHHLAEFLAYGWQYAGLEGRDWARWRQRKIDAHQWVVDVIDGRQTATDRFPNGRTKERVADIIVAMTAGSNFYVDSVDIRNDGCIPNLPDSAVVEVPGIVAADGIRGLHMAPLPEPIAALARQQIAIQELAVEAAVSGDRQVALQAMLLDPVVDDYEVAERVLDELLLAQRDYISENFFV